MDAREKFRHFAVLITGLVAILVVVVNFSETKTVLSCNGEFVNGEQTHIGNLYVSLNEYRWWVGLWGKGSDGNMHVEMPEGHLLYFDSVEELGPVWQVYKSDSERELMGSYSKLSKSLKLATPAGFFEGTCTATT